MKKLILTAALATAIIGANAQDMMSKKNTPILPEANDWSIGFDAAPLLGYFGNLFNNTVDNSVSARYQQNMTLVGKMMKDENTAIRAKVRIGFGSTSNDGIVDQDGSTSNPPATVTDNRKISSMNFTIGAGIQKYRGKGRLKGFYGAEAGIGLGSGKTTYTYGNAFSATNTSPNSTNWGGNLGGNGERTTEAKNGSTFGFNIRGFIGAEYFFAPKMSLSAEYGWGLGLTSTGEGESTVEFWDAGATTPGVKTVTTKTGKSSNFNLDVDNAGGQIVLSMYF
ncbi:MAG TPA: hypothetical protein PKK99_11715 [Bacteroidia bacterium]|nr:hypothetical protein [Bacteroidia bacterium]HNP99715.1 hypothetical protein [Bacteroidia bacterium]